MRVKGKAEVLVCADSEEKAIKDVFTNFIFINFGSMKNTLTVKEIFQVCTPKAEKIKDNTYKVSFVQIGDVENVNDCGCVKLC